MRRMKGKRRQDPLSNAPNKNSSKLSWRDEKKGYLALSAVCFAPGNLAACHKTWNF